ncbi:hypothetical protein [Nostoc sp. 'Peltigera membranacea cyanobiont' N6]|nr:hypothetical protein [Nostoc sp. 'Peltigera membranacea cyanobiont' N6]
MLLIILQLRGEDSNGVAGILDNQAGDKFWFGVATIEEIKTA